MDISEADYDSGVTERNDGDGSGCAGGYGYGDMSGRGSIHTSDGEFSSDGGVEYFDADGLDDGVGEGRCFGDATGGDRYCSFSLDEKEEA